MSLSGNRLRIPMRHIRSSRVSVLVLCGIMLMMAAAAAYAAPPSLSYARMTVAGVSMNVITADLNDTSLLVTPLVPTDIEHNRKTFREYLDEHHSLAQITGTFFDLGSGEAVGDVVIRGTQHVWSVGIGSALVVTPDNEPAIIDRPDPDTRWQGYESVLQGGLRLVKDGQVAVDPRAQGFNDRYMERKTSRVAVGILPGKRLVMIKSAHSLLPEVAAALAELGCTDAMALDGGGSTSMAYDGKCIIASGRKLANVLAIVQRSPEETAQRIATAQRREEAARVAALPPVASISTNLLQHIYPYRLWLLLLSALFVVVMAVLVIRRRMAGYEYPQEFFAGSRYTGNTQHLEKRPTPGS